MSNVIRKTVGVITLSVFSFFIGCERVEIGVEPLEFQLNVGLYEDMNGYYHLPLNLNNLQTLHRVSGRILRNGDPVDVVDFGWYCDMHWLSTDTMGYVVENIGSSELWYIGFDTTYLTWFSGFEVPIEKVLDRYKRKNLPNRDLARLIVAHIRVGVDGKKGWFLDLSDHNGQYEKEKELIAEYN